MRYFGSKHEKTSHIPTSIVLIFWWTTIFPLPVWGEEVRVALASNFLSTFDVLKKSFERESGHTTIVSPGASGKLYAQIVHGAPFDVFFSADAYRPTLLEENGLAVLGSRFAYAVGQLTLWSPAPNLLQDNGLEVLRDGAFSHLAIANPKTAPYGKAAEQVLRALGVWNMIQSKLVQGENIGQTLQFVASHNAELGFVGLSQVLDPKMKEKGSRWDVPPTMHEPLTQDVVLLKTGEHNPAAKALLIFLTSPIARSIIERYGYHSAQPVAP